mgnify:CR=1 FL=1
MVSSTSWSVEKLIPILFFFANAGATPQAYDSVSDVARVFASILKDHLRGDEPKDVAKRAIDGMLKGLDPWSRRIGESKAPAKGQSFVCLIDRGVIRLTIKRFNGDGKGWLKACPGLDRNFPVLIDLRDNPGGQVNDALGLANLFVANEDILVERRRHGEPIRHRADERIVRHAGLSILVNQRTGSAAELIAAALQRSASAKILGVRTMGKTTVQTAVHLTSGEIVLLTTGRLDLPSGEAIEGSGVQPDQALPASPSAFACAQAGRRWTSTGCELPSK